MFDDAIRKLKRLERGVRVPIQLPLDDDGYLDRRCSHPECQSDFKVLFDDWRDKVRDEEVFCPLCRHAADSGEWNTDVQQEFIQQTATRFIQKELGDAFRSSARRFNQSQPRGGFIKMSMSYRPGRLVDPLPNTLLQEANRQRREIVRGFADLYLNNPEFPNVSGRLMCPVCDQDFKRAADKLIGEFVTIIKKLQVTEELLFHLEFVLPESENGQRREDERPSRRSVE